MNAKERIIRAANSPEYHELQIKFDLLKEALKVCRPESVLYGYILDRMDKVAGQMNALWTEEEAG